MLELYGIFFVLGLYNVLVFFIYGWDKMIAGTKLRRVPEKILLGLAALGGGLGAVCGSFIFHHKTRKTSFQLILMLIIALQVGAVIWWYKQFLL